ncbi:MDR family MFS transporter [Clostridium sp. C2-6-12]|uniref:MDR family MFS transporter n=1 Tax=Clostridium sp. C2-6-12 TaxID=2698832 RepID=UPI00136CBD48|nr:MDR family MFS transporter [Clostridium sp. C2-6-12]
MNIKKKNIVIALMVSMFLGAIEGTVVTTAIPTIVKDLQGFQLISLVFSVYLLASAISTPIYGKLSDLYGRKKMLSIGIVIFLVGSFLCGASQNMYMLIIFRIIQGLGAGSIFTIPYTIVGDVFTLEERPKVQGMIGTVWGVASLAGPFLGGILIDILSWHWIFFINIPFGIISIILLEKNLEEDFERKKHKIDYAGIIILSIAMIIFLNIFNEQQNSNNIFNIISVFITIILLFVFYKIERKAEEPIIPFDIFTRTSIIINLISFLVAIILIGVNVYVPIYMQNVLGFSAKASGLSMAPMSVTWLIASVVLGKCILKYGGKVVTLIASFILFVGVILLITLNLNSSLVLVLAVVSIIGFGLGGVLSILTIIIQESVGYDKRGVATATNSLVKTIGETIGISLFGGIFNLYIAKYFIDRGINGVDSSSLYNSILTSEQIKLSINSSLHTLFILFVIIAIPSVILSIVIPKEK